MRIHSCGLSAFALLLLSSGNAWAADFVADNSAEEAAAFSGFHGGIAGAYGFGEAAGSFDFIQGGALDPVPPESPSVYNAERNGYLAGFQLGYDYHVDRFVFGPELDVSAGDIRSAVSETGISSGILKLPFRSTQTSALDRFATLRAQTGFFATDSLVLYGFGGLAVGRVKNDSDLRFTGGAVYDGGRAQTLTGWTAGAGASLAVAGPWRLELEYLHYDLGTATADAYRPVLSAVHT